MHQRDIRICLRKHFQSVQILFQFLQEIHEAARQKDIDENDVKVLS